MAYDQSPSCYYVWSMQPGKLIDANKLMIYRRAKALFKASHQNLGSRELAKKFTTKALMLVVIEHAP
jgi:putative transposase